MPIFMLQVSPLKPHQTTTVLWRFFQHHPGELVPEENFWTSWCNGRLTEADTPPIRLGTTPSGLTNAHLHHPPCFVTCRAALCDMEQYQRLLLLTSELTKNRSGAPLL